MYSQSLFLQNSDNIAATLFGTTTKLTPVAVQTYLEWLTQTPKTTTIRVNLLRTSLDEVKDHILNKLKQMHHLPISPAIEYCETFPEVILIKNLAEQQIGRIPRAHSKEVVVDAICGAAILRGAHIYGPGVLAMQSNTKIDEIVNVFADIEGACKQGTNTVYESKQKLYIGIGRVKMQRFQLFGIDTQPHGIAVEMIETVSTVPSIGDRYLIDGLALLQNLPSILCSRVLDPKPNEIILDMCAAPGNKTTHLAQLMQDTGILIALDKSERRVGILRENIQNFRFKCVQSFAFDATKAVILSHDENKNLDSNTIAKGPPFLQNSFDRILLDAPCSGFGNRPILTTKLTPKMISSYPNLQKKLLSTAVELLKVDGTLVYSTCTIFEAENELNVKWLLDKYADRIELEAAEPFFGAPGLVNVGLTDVQRKNVQRFGPNIVEYPMHDLFNDTIGFFIAKFKKFF